MTDHLIKYGMGRNYLPDWGLPEALREINQNFMDFGSFSQDVVSISETFCEVSMVNGFRPNGHDFMKIGESGKRDDPSKVGKHGEGLKMASLILARLGYPVRIMYGTVLLEGGFYNDDYLGECFGFFVREAPPIDGFRMSFQLPKEEMQEYEEKQLDPDVDVLHSSSYGDLLDRPKGEVYVGGHFVSVVEGLEYAYNFKPEHIELDRDRKVPKSFDVEWTASQILAGWSGLKLKDVVTKDATYMGRIPPRIAKRFKPSMTGGKVVFRANDVQAPPRVAEALMKMPINQRRVAKMKYSLSRKRNPHSILKEFFDRHMGSLSAEGRADAAVLLSKAKGWKS